MNLNQQKWHNFKRLTESQKFVHSRKKDQESLLSFITNMEYYDNFLSFTNRPNPMYYFCKLRCIWVFGLSKLVWSFKRLLSQLFQTKNQADIWHWLFFSISRFPRFLLIHVIFWYCSFCYLVVFLYNYSSSHTAQIMDFGEFLHEYCKEKSETCTKF